MFPSGNYHDFGDPFNDSDADLILRSKPSEPTRENDHGVTTQFHVHKVFLTKASPVFKRLLWEIQLPNTDDQLGITRDEYGHLPVLCLPEDCDTLHSLLTFIYPTNIARPRRLASMINTCTAAQLLPNFGCVPTRAIRPLYTGCDQQLLKHELTPACRD